MYARMTKVGCFVQVYHSSLLLYATPSCIWTVSSHSAHVCRVYIGRWWTIANISSAHWLLIYAFVTHISLHTGSLFVPPWPFFQLNNCNCVWGFIGTVSPANVSICPYTIHWSVIPSILCQTSVKYDIRCPGYSMLQKYIFRNFHLSKFRVGSVMLLTGLMSACIYPRSQGVQPAPYHHLLLRFGMNGAVSPPPSMS